MFVHPSREVRYDCSKPKGEYLHSSCLHTKSSHSDNNSRVPTCLRVQYTFSASVPGFTNNCNNPSNVSHTWPACDTAKRFKFRSKKNMKTNSQQSFLFRFKNTVQSSFHYLLSSGRFQWLIACPNQTHSQLQFKPTSLVTWCIWEIKINIPKQANTAHSVVNSQSQHQVPLCLQCHDGSYLSLSLSTLVPTLPGKQQCFRLQSQGHQSVQTSVKLHCSCHTTEPQVFNYSRITLQMWQLNQGHWQSKLDPPWFSCQRFSNLWQLNQATDLSGFSCQTFSTLWQLNQVTDLSGFSCQTFSHLWQLNQGYLPFRVLMPIFLSTTVTSRHDARLSSTTHCALRASRINYNLTNLSRCYSFLFSNMDLCSTLPSSPLSF